MSLTGLTVLTGLSMGSSRPTTSLRSIESIRSGSKHDRPPKRKDNVDTYAYFGEPVYIYSFKEAINDGFLTPFKAMQIPSIFRDISISRPLRREPKK